jgi:flagellar basal-body rod modification protein FlgD
MTAVDSSTSASILSALNKTSSSSSATSTATKKSSEQTLGQDAFLHLLVTQLKNQNPLDPQDNTAFVAQLAQFSSLEGIQSLNSTVTSLATNLQSSQALQASALVGRSVSVEGNKATFTQGGYVQGTVELPESTANMQLNIYNNSNQLVFTRDLGPQEAGEMPFAWDGSAADGTKLPSGIYRFEALARDGNKSNALTTYMGANVNSVTIGANQAVILNVEGIGPIALSDVKEIL